MLRVLKQTDPVIIIGIVLGISLLFLS